MKRAERPWLEINLPQKIFRGEGEVIYTMSSLFLRISPFHFTDKLHIWGSISIICSVVSDSIGTPWTVASQPSLPMGFSRQEYWSGLPFPSPGDLPNPGIKPGFPTLQCGFGVLFFHLWFLLLVLSAIYSEENANQDNSLKPIWVQQTRKPYYPNQWRLMK